jgi:chromosome segregation protein
VLFSHLRLSGFKSFVDSTELDISNGLTGVVGPNGCGKSNLVEALRWVMGETSAKQMRGGEMDDVIFNGTSDRPARNVAEVTLSVDNPDLTVPGPFTDSTELNIARRIERNKGSNYRINGRDVRSRDVQLLFADAGTGARSAGIISQGRIGTLINAKPSERRILLEEAANIRGLYTRRHEAELRLKGAETNLERLEDVLTAIHSQLKGLNQQAKQAVRYRTVNEQIRQSESILLHVRWESKVSEQKTISEISKESDNMVREATETAAKASTIRANLAGELPNLRNKESAASAGLQRLSLAINELDGEQSRINSAVTEAANRLVQMSDDLVRENALAQESINSVRQLKAEYIELQKELIGEEERHKDVSGSLEEINREADLLEKKVAEIAEKIAKNEASRTSFLRQINLSSEREKRLQQQIKHSEKQRIELGEIEGSADQIKKIELELEQATKSTNESTVKLDNIEKEKSQHASYVDKSYTEMQEIAAKLVKLNAESESLGALLSAELGQGLIPIVDEIVIASGYEAALAAALGDDLTAPIETENSELEKRVWTKNSTKHSGCELPEGVQSLAEKVRVPVELQERVKQVGIVNDVESAMMLQAKLAQGQCLTTLEGGLWRWDGFVAGIGTISAPEMRIRQRNRLRSIESDVRSLLNEQKDAAEVLAKLREHLDVLDDQEKIERVKYKNSYEKLDEARQKLGDMKRFISEWNSKIARLDDILIQLKIDSAEAKTQKELAGKEVGLLDNLESLKAENLKNRLNLNDKRSQLVDARSAYDELMRGAKERNIRLQAIGLEDKAWLERKDEAESRMKELSSRKKLEESEIKRLESRPEEIEMQRIELINSKQVAETARKEAADSLIMAESSLNDADIISRKADKDLASKREERVRKEAVLEQVNQSLEVLKERIKERLECLPEEILKNASINVSDVLPDIEATESRLERLTRERERIGPVNLRAEIEVAELDTQISTMEKERDDLTGAISRLRRAISSLNREGRDRLLQAFDTVNKHFQELFIRLFGGGTAHLTLVDTDDPLDAGVEIMTSPPGKKLQTMSLLSGGEQALTALALVFAAFLTNPSPICVLDEVDAPLDDSNVDRFCSLLADISKTTKTRFLIITHHRLTMARMDRLFGVTMSEQGVSQLVSVNLEGAEQLRDVG